MPFILDASVTACWALGDETHDLADQALDALRHDHAWVPALWWFEIRNILVVNERRGRIHRSASRAFLDDLARLPIRVDPLPDDGGVLHLARARGLSVYDAAYLDLAVRRDLALVTLDGKLEAAARAEGIPQLGGG
jgi:predicted nucleic acid-binding protein